MSAAPGSAQVARFGAAVALRFGLHFDEARSVWLGEVLQQRAAAARQEVEVYLARLESGAVTRELEVLAQELTVPETYFFRNADQLRALREVVAPDRSRARAYRGGLRILSAGCASGEEPYSIAMTLDGLPHAGRGNLSIHALDLNPEMIRKARRAHYAAWSLRDTSAELQAQWFRADGRDYVLDAAARFAVEFEVRNLCDDDPGFWRADAFDVVFCRNVLMYLTPPNARAVVERLRRSLMPGGYLFLGHAETLRGLSDAFHLRHTHGTFYYQRADGTEPAAAPAVDVHHAAPVEASRAPLPTSEDADWFETISGAAERIRALTANVGAPASPAAAPIETEVRLAGALELLRQERFAQALDVMRTLPVDVAGEPGALLLRAILLTHDGQFQEAEAACHHLLAVDGLNAGAHYVLALCREGGGDDASAADLYLAAITLDPAFAMPRLHLGLLARRAGDGGAARRELRRAQALLPREDAARLALFGGGFGREALLALCQAELDACGRLA